MPAKAALASVRRRSIDSCSTEEILELWKLRFVRIKPVFDTSERLDHVRDTFVVVVVLFVGASSEPLEPLDNSVKLPVMNSVVESVVVVGVRPK